MIFLLSAFAACPKSFLCLNINHMGVFLLPVSFLAFVILINNRFKTDKILLLLLSALVFIFAAQDFAALKDKNYLLKTNKGSIYAYKKDGMLIKEAVSCILENTKPEDRVLVMPEGAVINFITDRKGDNTYYNLSPLFYYDVFGEERILKHFKTEPAEWIIILPIDNIEYGFRYFGKDYAQKFYSFILENYTVEYSSDKMKIFKHRDYPAANN